jgi:predicted TIM-barrel fold metal-dependent hydrolase
VFETASYLGIAVMVHTGTGIPFSDCGNVEIPARLFPQTPIILAHGGANFFTDAAIETARRCDNVFLETSWCGIHHVRKMIRTLGAQKVIFASDHGDNLPVELEKYATLGLTDEQYEWCLSRTLKEALKLSLVQ